MQTYLTHGKLKTLKLKITLSVAILSARKEALHTSEKIFIPKIVNFSMRGKLFSIDFFSKNVSLMVVFNE